MLRRVFIFSLVISVVWTSPKAEEEEEILSRAMSHQPELFETTIDLGVYDANNYPRVIDIMPGKSSSAVDVSTGDLSGIANIRWIRRNFDRYLNEPVETSTTKFLRFGIEWVYVQTCCGRNTLLREWGYDEDKYVSVTLLSKDSKLKDYEVYFAVKFLPKPCKQGDDMGFSNTFIGKNGTEKGVRIVHDKLFTWEAFEKEFVVKGTKNEVSTYIQIRLRKKKESGKTTTGTK